MSCWLLPTGIRLGALDILPIQPAEPASLCRLLHARQATQIFDQLLALIVAERFEERSLHCLKLRRSNCQSLRTLFGEEYRVRASILRMRPAHNPSLGLEGVKKQDHARLLNSARVAKLCLREPRRFGQCTQNRKLPKIETGPIKHREHRFADPGVRSVEQVTYPGLGVRFGITRAQNLNPSGLWGSWPTALCESSTQLRLKLALYL